MPDRATDTEQRLRQIADMLLLNGTLTDCPGLVHGKTGIALFFFHYSQYTGIGLYEDYAMFLIEEIQSQIHNNSPADYEKGLAGIGAGIDYLVQNHFLKAEGDLFEDFDQRMYRAVMYDPWQDFSQYDGLTGYGRYWIVRLHQPASALQARECLMRIVGWIAERFQDIPVQEQTDVYCFLHDLYQATESEICPKSLMAKCCEWYTQINDHIRSFPRLGNSTMGKMVRIYQRSYYFDHIAQDTIEATLQQPPDLENIPVKTGILTGYAGDGLCRLAALAPQQHISWMQLL